LERELKSAISAALRAGREIMEVYSKGELSSWEKADNSPLTEADVRSHRVIVEGLKSFNFPILSEEGKDIPYVERREWEKFWLVDPLDGTKEFLKRNGEFTVNIALIKDKTPVLGVVYAPALDLLYYGFKGGAFKVERASTLSLEEIFTKGKSLPLQGGSQGKLRVVASRSHLSEETEEFIEELKKGKEVELVSVGSSLKLCYVAEGKADVYPRFAPTMEWDTAAGQAVVEASGGKVLDAKSLRPLTYNKESLLNPYFIALRKGYEL